MRILFIKLGAIGDIAQAAVAIKTFRLRDPTIQLDWVVGSGLSKLVKALSVADEVLGVDDSDLFSSSFTRRVASLFRIATALARLRRYDRIVTAYSDPRYGLLSIGVKSCLRVRFRPKADRPSPLQYRNRVHEYFSLLSGNESVAFDLASAARMVGENLSQSAGRMPAGPTGSYVVLAAGGAKNMVRDDALRRWPIENFRLLGAELLSAGRKVVLVGSVGDRWVSASFAGLAVLDLIGKTELLDLVGVLANADVVVANDSGVLHLAALTNSGVVGLFGPTPANAIIPLGRDRTVALEPGNRISCSPCYDGRGYAPCSRNICLEAISVGSVVKAVVSVSTQR